MAAEARAPVRGAGRFAARPAPSAVLPSGTAARRGGPGISRSILSRRAKSCLRGKALASKGGKVRGRKPREVIKTAMTLQVRGGHLYVFMPPCEKLEAYVALLAAVEDTARGVGHAGGHRRLYAAARSARQGAERDARPRRHRSQHPSGGVVARLPRDDGDAVRRSSPVAARHRKIHARRPAHRDRRRQSRHAGGRHARRQSAPAPSGSAAKPDHLLAEPSVAVVPVFGNVHRADQPGAARRRGARRPPVRTGDRLPAAGTQARRPAARRRSRGWSTACCGTC